jgi:hypothetical protein
MVKKHKSFCIQTYEICDVTGYTHFMKACLCKDLRLQLRKWQRHMQMGNIVPGRWKGLDINNNMWTVPFNILLCVMIWLIEEVNCCSTVLPNQEVMSCDLGCKTLTIELGNIQARVREFSVQLYRRTGEKCMYWHTCTNHHWKYILKLNITKLLLKGTACTWVTAWQIATQSAYSQADKSCSFVFRICPFWIAGPCFHLVALRFFIEVSESTQWEILQKKQDDWSKLTV